MSDTVNLPFGQEDIPSLSTIAIERERREAQRRTDILRTTVLQSLDDWARLCGFEPADHHRLMNRALMALERGEYDNLAIMAPPGSAKTTYVSHLFVAWYLARNPQHRVLSGSHTADFASRKIGRVVRNMVEQHHEVLGIDISADSRSMDDWALSAGGTYLAAGVGNAIQGERMDLGVVEDPFSRWEDAQSPGAQETVWEWYTGDFTPRLKPHARRIVVMTRFNEFDLLGRIFERDKALGINWHVLRLPMIAGEDDPVGRSPGERLWPEWFTDRQIIEARSDPQKWSALYQQTPSNETGDYFQVGWLKPYVKRPPLDTMMVYGASDYAVTADGGDYTCHIVVGIDPEDAMYVLDVYRARASSDRWVSRWCDLVVDWKPMEWAEENGQIKSGVGPFLEREARVRRAYVTRTGFTSRADKAIRAQSIRGRMAMNGLYVPMNAPWYPDFRAELLAFPQGKHDDQVDALGLIGQLLDKMVEGQRPKVTFEPERDPYRERLDDEPMSFKLL